MKIKKVIIEGFRAYQTRADGTFDFTTPSGECAQFVSIFAPNGFGKTSFYDAVEWALTNNIERFIRDIARLENDNLSRSQNQESRRQHILRNRSIPDTASCSVTVIGDDFDDVVKTVSRARAGSRDYLFRREKADPGMEEVAGIFLSQEAIDGFMREEKPELRYSRFMDHFGDSDEIYRANLIAVKRELAIILKSAREEQERLESILSAPVDAEIFANINSTLEQLNSASENIPSIQLTFDANGERELRNLITRRSHELENAVKDLLQFQAELEAALSELPNISAAVTRHAGAERELGRLLLRRSALVRYSNLKQNITALTESIEREHKSSLAFQSLLDKVPAFDDLLQKLAEFAKKKQDSETGLRQQRAELSSFEQRIVASRKALAELDSKATELVTLRQRSVEIYRELATVRAGSAEKRVQRLDRQQRHDALVGKLTVQRDSLSKLSALEISERSVNSADLALLSGDGVSPLPLHEAIVEKNLRDRQVAEAAKALETFQLQKDHLATLVSLGSELLSKSQSNQCPLCAHEHASHDALMHQIVSNSALSALEAVAVQNKNLAQQAFDAVALRVVELLEEWQKRKAQASADLRGLVTQDELHLRQIALELQNLDLEIQQDDARALKLNEEVMGLSADLFAEKIAADLQDLVERRAKEESEIGTCDVEAARRRDAIKVLGQTIGECETQVDLLTKSDVYVEVSSFCLSQAVEPIHLAELLNQRLQQAQKRLQDVTESLKGAKSETEGIESADRNIQHEQLSDIEREEERARKARLEAEAILSTFISKIATHLPDYQTSWASEEIAQGINRAIASIRARHSVATALLRGYSLLDEQLKDLLPFLTSIAAKKDLDKVLTELEQFKTLEVQVDAEYRDIIGRLQARIDGFFFTKLINSIYKKIDPHPEFKEVCFVCEFPEGDRPRLHVLVSDEQGESIAPNLYFSAAQVNILSLSIFLARALHVRVRGKHAGCIFIDDPIHSMDSINVLSTIDLLRTISKKFETQIILSTHDRNFFELLKRKIPEHEYASKFIELETFGKVQAG